MSGFEGKDPAAKDQRGNWWYQDPTTASWYIWNGQFWERMPGAAPRIAPRQNAPKSKKRAPWPCLLTAFIGGLIAFIVVSVISLVAYQFFPGYHINPGQGDLVQIVKLRQWSAGDSSGSVYALCWFSRSDPLQGLLKMRWTGVVKNAAVARS